MARTNVPGYGQGVVAIAEPELDIYLAEPRELIARFRAPGYRPPMLPSIALELHALTQRRLCDLRQVLTLIERDPMVAARVLRTAQSTLYATKAPVRSLDDALARLGLETLSQIVFEVTTGMTLFRVPGYDEPMERVRKHSTATAYLARAVARVAGQPTELAFLCGLLHDIGIVACLLVFAQPGPGARAPSFAAAWAVIEPVHPEVSGLLAGLWRLPPELQAAMAQHHLASPDSALARTVFVADAITTQLGVGVEAAPESGWFDLARRQLGVSDALLPELMAYGARVVAELT